MAKDCLGPIVAVAVPDGKTAGVSLRNCKSAGHSGAAQNVEFLMGKGKDQPMSENVDGPAMCRACGAVYRTDCGAAINARDMGERIPCSPVSLAKWEAEQDAADPRETRIASLETQLADAETEITVLGAQLAEREKFRKNLDERCGRLEAQLAEREDAYKAGMEGLSGIVDYWRDKVIRLSAQLTAARAALVIAKGWLMRDAYFVGRADVDKIEQALADLPVGSEAPKPAIEEGRGLTLLRHLMLMVRYEFHADDRLEYLPGGITDHDLDSADALIRSLSVGSEASAWRPIEAAEKPWADLLEPIVKKLDLAATFDGTKACWNQDGAKALAALMREMCRLLDEEIARRLPPPPTTETGRMTG